MNDKQADEMIGLLRLIFGELVGMRQDLADFTNSGVQDMRTTVEDITGPTGYHLGDLHAKLGDIELSLANIEANTAA